MITIFFTETVSSHLKLSWEISFLHFFEENYPYCDSDIMVKKYEKKAKWDFLKIFWILLKWNAWNSYFNYLWFHQKMKGKKHYRLAVGSLSCRTKLLSAEGQWSENKLLVVDFQKYHIKIWNMLASITAFWQKRIDKSSRDNAIFKF